MDEIVWFGWKVHEYNWKVYFGSKDGWMKKYIASLK